MVRSGTGHIIRVFRRQIVPEDAGQDPELDLLRVVQRLWIADMTFMPRSSSATVVPTGASWFMLLVC
jgi:hypothetical protein